jgi:hypothetical protein
MSGIRPDDLLAYVIRPVLAFADLGGTAAEELLLGTAAQESGMGARLAQVGGPARGLWQIEEATHDDLWRNFLPGRPALANAARARLIGNMAPWEQITGNLYYACLMARLVYERAPAPLPAAGDLAAQAAYYKAHYNTPRGAATAAEYIENAKAIGL